MAKRGFDPEEVSITNENLLGPSIHQNGKRVIKPGLQGLGPGNGEAPPCWQSDKYSTDGSELDS